MKLSSNFRAGTFMFIAVVTFMVTVLVLGKERRIFTRTVTLSTAMANVGGLSVGAPVRLGGITVGRVADIGFAPEGTDPTVHVQFTIEKKFLSRVPRSSVVTIETQGLLGDKFIQVNPGIVAPDEQLIAAGTVLRSKEPTDVSQILQKANAVVDNTVEISDSVKKVLEKVEEETIHEFAEAVKGAAEIGRAVREEDGVLHKLIYASKDGENLLDSLTKAAASIEQVTEDMKTKKGLLNSLIYDPKGAEFVAELSAAAKNLSETSSQVAEIAAEIKAGNGIMHQLVYDESVDVGAKISATVDQLQGVAKDLKTASEALANGEGTIGALLVDPQLYDNLVEITSGAKRSFLLRQAIKTSLK